MTKIIHRSLRATPPVAVGGEGVCLIDAAGKRYLDASGGAAVSCLGHGHPDVIAAMDKHAFVLLPSTPERLGALVKAQMDSYRNILRAAGGQPE